MITMNLQCPECGSPKVTLAHVQKYMANSMEHYCHSIKVQDDDSPSNCLDCNWEGKRKELKLGESKPTRAS